MLRHLDAQADSSKRRTLLQIRAHRGSGDRYDSDDSSMGSRAESQEGVALEEPDFFGWSTNIDAQTSIGRHRRLGDEYDQRDSPGSPYPVAHSHFISTPLVFLKPSNRYLDKTLYRK